MMRIDDYPTHEKDGIQFRCGRVQPFGASIVSDSAVNFSVFSKDAVSCELLLYHHGVKEPYAVIPFPEEFRISNEFTEPEDSKKKVYTVKDPTRNAVTTSYSDNKEGITGKETKKSRAPYWTRTPGMDLTYPGHISGNGGAYCASMHMDEFRVNIRPVLRMNLYDFLSLWSYAGTVSSDGTVNENTGLEGERTEN